MLWEIVLAVFVAGCIGGAVTGMVAPARGLRYKDPEVCDTWFPGLLGNLLLGGVGAVVFWGLYGPLAGATVLGMSGADEALRLTVGELAASIVIGIGGPGFLLAEAGRRCAEKQLPRKMPADWRWRIRPSRRFRP